MASDWKDIPARERMQKLGDIFLDASDAFIALKTSGSATQAELDAALAQMEMCGAAVKAQAEAIAESERIGPRPADPPPPVSRSVQEARDAEENGAEPSDMDMLFAASRGLPVNRKDARDG